jgi:hypothetical protein
MFSSFCLWNIVIVFSVIWLLSIFSEYTCSAAFAAGFSHPLKDSGTITTEAFPCVFFGIGVENEFTPSISFTAPLTILIVVSGLVVVVKEALVVSILFDRAGFVIMNDGFRVAPKVGGPFYRGAGSEQTVEKVFDKSSFASTHVLILSLFCCFQGFALFY